MDKEYSARTPMIVRSLKRDKNPFRPKEGEEVLRQEYSYLSVSGALMYLTNNTRPDTVNYLVRHSAAPTIRHWNNIKNMLQYLIGTIDLGLYF
jgi:hypothetical protein